MPAPKRTGEGSKRVGAALFGAQAHNYIHRLFTANECDLSLYGVRVDLARRMYHILGLHILTDICLNPPSAALLL